MASLPSDLLILGDFNLHIDVSNDFYSSEFLTLLQTFDLCQHITSPTHSSGHILDLLISRKEHNISQVNITDPLLSDHSAVLFQVPLSFKTYSSRVIKSIRKFSAINIDDFCRDIISSRSEERRVGKECRSR